MSGPREAANIQLSLKNTMGKLNWSHGGRKARENHTVIITVGKLLGFCDLSKAHTTDYSPHILSGGAHGASTN